MQAVSRVREVVCNAAATDEVKVKRCESAVGARVGGSTLAVLITVLREDVVELICDHSIHSECFWAFARAQSKDGTEYPHGMGGMGARGGCPTFVGPVATCAHLSSMEKNLVT